VLSFLQKERLSPYSLTPQEAEQARQTPDITSNYFSLMFGCRPFRERPPRTNRTNVNTIIVKPRYQVYGPTSLGKPGLLLLGNSAPLEEPSLVFLQVPGPAPGPSLSTSLYRYLGTYVKVPIARTTLEVDEWLALPSDVSMLRLLLESGYHF
jgi:hypothetical protein